MQCFVFFAVSTKIFGICEETLKQTQNPMNSNPPFWNSWIRHCKTHVVNLFIYTVNSKNWINVCKQDHYNYACLCAELQPIHYVITLTRWDCTDLQVIHDHTALSYRWCTITLYWFTGDTRLLCTELQAIHCYTALTYRYTRSHCPDLRLIQDFYALPYRCYMITLDWLTSETQSHCNYLKVIHYYSGMTSQWLTSYSQYHWLTGYTRSHWFTGYTRFHLHTGYTRTDLQPINDPTDLQAKHARTYRLGCRWSVEYQEWLMW